MFLWNKFLRILGSVNVKLGIMIVFFLALLTLTNHFFILTLWGKALCVIVISLLLSWFLKWHIISPIYYAKTFSEAIAKGNLSIEDNHLSKRNDEIGDLFKMLQKMRDDISRRVREEQRISLKLADSAKEIAKSVGVISEGNKALTSQSIVQAQSIDETTTQVAGLSTYLKDNATKAEALMHVVAETKNNTDKVQQYFDSLGEAMQDIVYSNDRISEIVDLINSLSFKTNLLSLNAAVEAAHAGKHGKGFTVVAKEVRNLAESSAEAAQTIVGLIDKCRKNIATGSELIDVTRSMYGAIYDGAIEVRDVFGGISQATMEQSQSVEDIKKTIHVLNQLTHDKSSLVERLSQSTRSLNKQSSEMMRVVRQLEGKN